MNKTISSMLDRITQNPGEKRNILSLGLNMLIKNADAPLVAGTELQAFQVRIGLSTSQIGSLGSVGQITMAIATFLLMGLPDRIKNQVNAFVLLTLGMAIYPIALVLMSIGPSIIRRAYVVFPTMVALEIVDKVLLALGGMVFATLFVRTIHGNIRGRFMGIIGVVGGIIGILCGLLSSKALKMLGYPHGFTFSFGMGVVLILLAAYAMKHVRELPELSHENPTAAVNPLSSLWTICKMREFKLLAPPNILRGLGDGASFFVMAVGMQKLHLGVEYAGYTTSLIFLGLILGTSILGFTVDRYGAGRVLFSSEVFVALGLMGIVLTHSPIFFLVFFLMLQVSSNVEAYTIPLAHYAIVPASVIGAFFGVRLMILYLTAAITTQISGILLKRVDYFVYVFAVCAVLKLITGVLYWYAFNKGRKDADLEAANAV